MSKHFIDILKATTVNEIETIVSYDVESLFTNVQIKECIDVFKVKVTKLLEHYLNTNYFLYNGQYYFQIDGVDIGRPVAPMVANISMEHLEHAAILTAPLTIKLWKRYVVGVRFIRYNNKSCILV